MIKEALAFDDVLLKPVYSEVRSRIEPNTSTTLGKLTLGIPIISSPMDTVTELDMAVGIARLGGAGVIHRFMKPEAQINIIREISSLKIPFVIPVIPAIGVTPEEMERLDYIMRLASEERFTVNMVSVDIANGHSILMMDAVKIIKERHPGLSVMAGNVATLDGYKFLSDLGVDVVRVGIGGGSICKTRIQTGFGIPTLQSILDCKHHKLICGGAKIIADGGIRYPSDVVKSIVAGADAVMVGGLFAGTKESPGDIIYTEDGKPGKRYRGMASEEVQNETRGGLKPGTVAEGVSTLVPYKGSLERVVNDLVGGLRSGMSYGNCRNLSDLLEIEMVRITGSGIEESHAYGTRR